jgi:hypothetical protein
MTRALLDLDAIPTVFPDQIATAAELVGLGLSGTAIRERCRPDGPWQHLQPGIVLLSNAPPARAHRLRAALKVAGAGAVVTGHDALRLQGLLAGPPGSAGHVLVPRGRRLRPLAGIRFERADPMPEPLLRQGFPVTPPARALVDACRGLSSAAAVRGLVTDAVRRDRVTTTSLRRELAVAGRRGGTALRTVLAEIDADVRSVAEGWARRLAARAGLPPPRWRVPLRDQTDKPLATVDAWWDTVGLAWDLGPLEPEEPALILRHCARLAATGVIVVHTPTHDLRDNPAAVAKELRTAYSQAADRPRPPVVAA